VLSLIFTPAIHYYLSRGHATQAQQPVTA
jgi:hypothetical protein